MDLLFNTDAYVAIMFGNNNITYNVIGGIYYERRIIEGFNRRAIRSKKFGSMVLVFLKNQ